MRTGFPNPRPISFLEYDAGLSNISFEARIENFAKADFDPADYEQIRQEARSISIPGKLWDPASQIQDEDLVELAQSIRSI